jgi:hypothetical protein
MISVIPPSGAQHTLAISEEGLYFFLNRSDKAAAIPFQKWVAGSGTQRRLLISEEGITFSLGRSGKPRPFPPTWMPDTHLSVAPRRRGQ